MRDQHWKSITRVLWYLRYTHTFGFHYTRYSDIKEGYNEANCISNIKYSKLTSGFLFTLRGGVISWKSSNKICIARSTMEYEFITLDKSKEEVVTM